MNNSPFLSVVATSRNDDHGGNALWRTQHFVDGLAAQAEYHKIPIELVLVDWNPPQNKPPLFEALRWPETNAYFTCRVIEVPSSFHNRFPHADKLPLFQYIAKNIGIRRAKGKFILATNIDILFSNKLINFLKEDMKLGHLYRVDRYDIDPGIPEDIPFQEVLRYAQKHTIRINNIRGTFSDKTFKNKTSILFYFIKNFSLSIISYPYKLIKYGINHIKNSLHKKRITLYEILKYEPLLLCRMFYMLSKKIFCDARNFLSYIFQIIKTPILHTNACGDFTLLSKQDWFNLRGYPEWAQYSWHIDSVLVYQAYHSGIKMHNLPTEYAIYHIEHGQGSGWTPEGASLLFKRLDQKGIAYMNDEELANEFKKQKQMEKLGKPIHYNEENWGAEGHTFAEKEK